MSKCESWVLEEGSWNRARILKEIGRKEFIREAKGVAPPVSFLEVMNSR
jgi:hypothetical protein